VNRRAPILVLVVATTAGACGKQSATLPTSPTPTPSSPFATFRVFGNNRVPPETIVRWFDTHTPRPSGTYAATVPLETMAQIFIEEGAAEGVTGDIAFVQSIVETA
jgi:hypothetical protein